MFSRHLQLEWVVGDNKKLVIILYYTTREDFISDSVRLLVEIILNVLGIICNTPWLAAGVCGGIIDFIAVYTSKVWFNQISRFRKSCTRRILFDSSPVACTIVALYYIIIHYNIM